MKTVKNYLAIILLASLAMGSLKSNAQIKLWGMTRDGGTSNLGVLFQYDPVLDVYTKKIDFDGTGNGSSPLGSLIKGIDGKFYGMTQGGGSNNFGVIFRYDPGTSTYTKLLEFDGPNGEYPFGSLLQLTDGTLYGTTHGGGIENQTGVLFSYNPATLTYTHIHSWDSYYGYGGMYPGGLMVANNGTIYGITSGGGGYFKAGTIYSYNPSTSVWQLLYSFDLGGADGWSPSEGPLVQASNGKLYGTTTFVNSYFTPGYGVIFSFDPVTSIYSKEFEFDNTINGGKPRSGLIKASNGKLYGLTEQGGSSNSGVIYSFDPITSTFLKLYDFDGLNGGAPRGNLMQASDGKLYGMTSYGGTVLSNNNKGVIFSYDYSGAGTFTKLKEFNNIDGNSSGAAPEYGNFLEVNSNNQSVPTLSEWGLIALAGLLVIFGAVYVRKLG